jgi:DNA polymerase III epsilon subunit family exonuclease
MSISLLDKLSALPLAFVDVETTGASAAYGDRVTEVAVLRVENGVVVDRWSSLVNPGRRIAPGVVALTGITPAMVADAPTFRGIAGDVAAKLRGTVVIGHNVGFDIAFLRAEFRAASMDLDDAADLRKTLDTVRIARRIHGRGGNGLQRLAARLEVMVEVAHRALADCLTTAAVFERMLEPLGGGRLSLADVLMLQGGPLKLGTATLVAAQLPIELDEALTLRREVRMVYLDARNNRTERVIIPIQLTRLGEERSLTAFCALRQEQRSFKLSRIVELTRIESAFETTGSGAAEPLQSSTDEPFPESDTKDEPVRPQPQPHTSRPEIDPDAIADRSA